MVDMVDFTFWEKIEEKKYVLWSFNGWLGWLSFLGKKYVYGMSLSMVDLVDFTFWKKIEKKKCVMSLSMVDFVDFKFWGIKWKNQSVLCCFQ